MMSFHLIHWFFKCILGTTFTNEPARFLHSKWYVELFTWMLLSLCCRFCRASLLPNNFSSKRRIFVSSMKKSNLTSRIYFIIKNPIVFPLPVCIINKFLRYPTLKLLIVKVIPKVINSKTSFYFVGKYFSVKKNQKNGSHDFQFLLQCVWFLEEWQEFKQAKKIKSSN